MTGSLATAMLVRIGEATNRTLVLPVVMFYPTSRCNSRCVSCDWWMRSGATDLTLFEIRRLAETLPSLGTRTVVFSGGEPLLRPDVFDAARLFRAQGLALHLLTSGVLLERCAADVVREFSRVVVSLDAADEALYAAVRGVNALRAVERGVARVRALAPDIPVTARATLHRANFRELPRLIDHAAAMALDGISFLAADTFSSAFGRTGSTRAATDPAALALSAEEAAEFADVVSETIASHAAAFQTGFVSETPDRLRRLPQYYAALAGTGSLPPVSCNAPWISVVVEADGSVRPCFFHAALGNVRHTTLASIVAGNLPAFRAALDISRDPICTRCVCSIKGSWRHAPWQ